MNSTLTLTARTTNANSTNASSTLTTWLTRPLVCKWDMLAVLGLMASSAVYGVYALTQMTGF